MPQAVLLEQPSLLWLIYNTKRLANIALRHIAVLKHQTSQANLEAVSFTLNPLSELSAASPIRKLAQR
jgi:hypothetical protein